MISYRPFWVTLKEKKISQYALIHTYHLSPAQITRLKQDKGVSTHTINMLCKILDCDIVDILVYTPDPADPPESPEAEMNESPSE